MKTGTKILLLTCAMDDSSKVCQTNCKMVRWFGIERTEQMSSKGCVMPKLRDSDTAKWEYNLHTEIKHRILKAYLPPWITILSKTGRGLVYVDGFSGRGCYNGGEPGSPLLVVEAMAMHPNRYIPYVCHFVEKDSENFANMRAAVEVHRAVKSGRVRCYFHNEAFSTVGAAIVKQIRTAEQPSFFFVDPFGYTDPTMGMLREILALPKAEIFVNLMFYAIRRGLGSDDPTLHLTLDRLTGTTGWRTIHALPRSQWETAFIALYRRQLKHHGANFATPFRMGDDARATTLYYLIHATKHIKGAEVMKSAMTASGTLGELGYSGDRHYLTPLFDVSQNGLPEYLLRNFAGQTVTYDAVLARTIDDTGTCKDSHYRQCLKQLEKNGCVVVRRVSSTLGRGGLRGLDEITFQGQLSLLPAASA